MRIALIGSRELEKNPIYSQDIQLCYNVAYRLACLHIIFTSGLCELGMDGLAQKAYSKAVIDGKASINQFEVYVSEQKMINKSKLPNSHLAVVAPSVYQTEAERIASSIHPAWDKCNEYARGQHKRNCHQILGANLASPVDAVICWTPNGKIQGGTATAIKLALKNNIPVFNLGCSDKDKVLNDIKEFLLEQNKKNGESFINEL